MFVYLKVNRRSVAKQKSKQDTFCNIYIRKLQTEKLPAGTDTFYEVLRIRDFYVKD